jgi:hypothetical protein
MKKKPEVFTLHRRGHDFPRYFVGNSAAQVWTGNGWSDDEAEALLFGEPNDGCLEIHRLHLLSSGTEPLRRFRAPVYLDLYGGEDIPQREVELWLGRAARLLINAEAHGNGPRNALGLVRIEWGETEELR